jgi:hypothetical protein
VQASWSDVWKLGLSVFAQQSIEVQILIGLAAAFCAVMVIEGLRASFFPRRRAAAIQPIAKPEQQAVFIPQPPAPQAMAIAPSQSFAAKRLAAPSPSLKRKLSSVRRHKTTRPIIRRMANGAELTGHDQEMTA